MRPGSPGVRFTGVSFTPSRPGDGKYADTAVAGVRLHVTDLGAYDPTVTAVYLLAAIRSVHGARFAWLPRHFDRLAGGPTLRAQLERGADPAAIVRGWAPALQAFRERRKPALLYPE